MIGLVWWEEGGNCGDVEFGGVGGGGGVSWVGGEGGVLWAAGMSEGGFWFWCAEGGEEGGVRGVGESGLGAETEGKGGMVWWKRGRGGREWFWVWGKKRMGEVGYDSWFWCEITEEGEGGGVGCGLWWRGEGRGESWFGGDGEGRGWFVEEEGGGGSWCFVVEREGWLGSGLGGREVGWGDWFVWKRGGGGGGKGTLGVGFWFGRVEGRGECRVVSVYGGRGGEGCEWCGAVCGEDVWGEVGLVGEGEVGQGGTVCGGFSVGVGAESGGRWGLEGGRCDWFGGFDGEGGWVGSWGFGFGMLLGGEGGCKVGLGLEIGGETGGGRS
uniref:Uncharacterized protein n=1 Tax=Knipowitschia caucasica TaxID=637954 RepID=A0AAV2JTS8_KNICA